VLVAGFDERDGIESPAFLWFGAAMTVAFSFAGIMLIRYKAVADRFYQALDRDLLGFFCALFLFIHVIEQAHVLHVIGLGLERLIGLGESAGPASVLWGAAVFSSVTDNIPLAAMLANILQGLVTAPDSPLWWSVVFGANLGGNLTPIGSASTLVAVTIIHKHGLAMIFGRFVKIAFVHALMQLVLATATCWSLPEVHDALGEGEGRTSECRVAELDMGVQRRPDGRGMTARRDIRDS